MKKVCVITGGGGGMGLATAKIMGKRGYYIILADIVASKLENGLACLKEDNIEAEMFLGDISNRESDEKLAARAKETGRVAAVIHTAGLSPQLGEPERIMRVNALGTINIAEAFYEVMGEGSCMVNVASMAAYVLPGILLPSSRYKYSRTDRDMFLRKMMARVNLLPQKVRTGIAYCISKNFVVWYTKTSAAKMMQKGIRIISVSPGSFDTPMGMCEKDHGAEEMLKSCAIKRFGRPEEIAYLFAFCVDERLGYLTGEDILCDGGCIAGRRKNK